MSAATSREPLVRPPRLRGNQTGGASRLKLFFDLAYVLVVLELAEGLYTDLTWHGLAVLAGLFIAVWFSRVGYTLYANRFDTDDVVSRLAKPSGSDGRPSGAPSGAPPGGMPSGGPGGMPPNGTPSGGPGVSHQEAHPARVPQADADRDLARSRSRTEAVVSEVFVDAISSAVRWLAANYPLSDAFARILLSQLDRDDAVHEAAVARRLLTAAAIDADTSTSLT